jgi:acyl-CoA synthetase (AMP-forming)/AMP-acid ligase II
LNIVTLPDMAASGNPDRIAVGRLRSTAEDADPLSYPDLLDRARAGAGALRKRGAAEFVYLGAQLPARLRVGHGLRRRRRTRSGQR